MYTPQGVYTVVNSIICNAHRVANPNVASGAITPEEVDRVRAETQAIALRVRGNKPEGSAISEADMLLMTESAFRRAVQIIDEAQGGGETPLLHPSSPPPLLSPTPPVWTETEAEQNRFIDAWAALARRHSNKMVLEVDFSAILSLVGMLQLSLRHPMITPANRRVTRGLVDGVIHSIGCLDPFCADMLKRGDDPRFDRRAPEGGAS